VPIVKKIRVGEGVEKGVVGISRELRRFRLELALSSLRHMNPLVERGIIGKAAEEAVRRRLEKITIKRKLNKIGSTKYGRAYINNIVINLAKKYGKEKIEADGIELSANPRLKLVRKELKQLFKNKEIKGIDYIENVRAIIFKYFDRDSAIKIDKELMLRLHMAEVGKRGIVDLMDGRTFYSSSKPINFRTLGRNNIAEGLMLAGVKKTKKDYFDLKMSQIILEAIRSSKTPFEASAKFEELYRRELEKDPIFRKVQFEVVSKELIRMYNLAGMVGALHETLKTVPSRLVAMASRLLASAYRMIPIVGAIAATNVEAAGAIAEIGEALSNRIESSAYMYYSLGDVLGDKLPLLQSLEQARRSQITA